MVIKERNKDTTNRAWNKLYQRLEQNGLLTENTAKQSASFSTLKWAAGLVAFALLFTFVLLKTNSKQTNLLTLHNEKGATTLITTLNDGSTIYLSENTSLQYPKEFSNTKREVFLQGTAFFDIKEKNDCPFFIETELIQIEVIGTAFEVENNEKFSLSVQRGEVKVTLKNSKQSVNVKAGESVLLNLGNLKVFTGKNTDTYKQHTQAIRFKDERLGDIIKVINSNSDIQIEISPELNNRLLTVTFTNETPESMANLICLALNLQYTQKQNKIIITEP